MRKLFLLLISNPVPVVLLVFMVVWSGSFALLHLPTGLFPGLDVPLVNVISHFAGADPENMELLITRPIEDRIRTIPGVRRVSSTSVEGISQITADFAWGIQLTDARQLVQAELSSLQGTLPSGVQPHLESIGTTLQEVMGYVVFGTGDLVELRNAVRFDLAARLMGVEGVSRVEVLGGDEPAFNVQLIPGALERNHLTIGALTTALAQYNQVAAAGYLDRGSREYLIRGDSRLKTITDVQDVPVVSDGIHSVFIRDLADVKRSVVPKHYEVSANGYPAIALVISKMPDADTIAVTRGCEQEMRELQNLLPQGARVRKFYDQADILIESRHSLLVDMLIGAFFAAAVLFFFLGTWRAALIVTATIPISLLATLAVMKACGQSLNVITLSALTLVIGMVVDDAIIFSVFNEKRQ